MSTKYRITYIGTQKFAVNERANVVITEKLLTMFEKEECDGIILSIVPIKISELEKGMFIFYKDFVTDVLFKKREVPYFKERKEWSSRRMPSGWGRYFHPADSERAIDKILLADMHYVLDVVKDKLTKMEEKENHDRKFAREYARAKKNKLSA